MSKVKRLLANYEDFISIPWRRGLAPAQRVTFCIYPQSDELRFRATLGEFELATQRASHRWLSLDLTDTFAHWLSGQPYAKSYFKRPQLLQSLLPRYLDYLGSHFKGFLNEAKADDLTVVALTGVGSLFGLVRVNEVVERFAPLVFGRLAVFFPGTYEGNNYRLLDGYDGWNYLAVPITPDKEF